MGRIQGEQTRVDLMRTGIFSANNIATLASSVPGTLYAETDFWISQMENLGVDAAEMIMKLLGYKQTEEGVFFRT